MNYGFWTWSKYLDWDLIINPNIFFFKFQSSFVEKMDFNKKFNPIIWI